MTGIILLDKPKDITSFLAIAKVRRIVNEKKAGHTGTLDPMATGVMPVMLGGATRFIDYLPSHDKTYRAKFVLGFKTDTLDITGKVVDRFDIKADCNAVKTALEGFVGEIEQLPPMYSAVLKDGVRLYELARKGIEVEREKRRVTIYSARFDSYNEQNGEYEITVECSSGTYIRALVNDIGDALGCGAVLTQLQRTSANGFNIEDCLSLNELEEKVKNGEIESVVIPIEKALESYSRVVVTQAQANRFRNGGELDIERLKIENVPGIYTAFSPENEFLGLGQIIQDSDSLKVKKVFVKK